MTSVIEREEIGGPGWHVEACVDKYQGDWTPEEIEAGLADASLFDSIIEEGNLLLIGGASAQWETLLGNGTGTAGQALTYFNNANARLGIGDSSTAESETQTGLQAATNKTYKAMDSTYPLHTDSTGTAGSRSITFRATFGSSDANYVWAEWVVDNGTRALNRKVAALGTKASGTTWVLTITVTLNAS